jgi:hypothetical protein
LRCDGLGWPAIVEHVVRTSKSGMPIELGRHDGSYFLWRETTADNNPVDLLVLRAIDYQHPIHPFGNAASLQQQGHDRHPVRSMPPSYLLLHLVPDQGMQRAFKTGSRGGIGKGTAAKLRPVQFTGWQQYGGIEGGNNRRVSGLISPRKAVRNEIGIRDLDVSRREGSCDRRFAAADAARHADEVGHVSSQEGRARPGACRKRAQSRRQSQDRGRTRAESDGRVP